MRNYCSTSRKIARQLKERRGRAKEEESYEFFTEECGTPHHLEGRAFDLFGFVLRRVSSLMLKWREKREEEEE
jgi:hypothetical protein